MFPSFEDSLKDECSHDSNTTWEWPFGQVGAVSKNAVVDDKRKEVLFDLTKSDRHVCDQHG